MTGFDITRWSLILQTRDDGAPAQKALEELCRRYRGPVLAFLKARGYPSEDAEDHTQAFFAHLLSQRLHHSADPTKGRFRNYLLTSLKHFLNSERRREQAGKRGGAAEHVEIGSIPEPAGPDSPDLAFEREWARAVLSVALRRLHEEARDAGKEPLFLALRKYLFESPDSEDYAETSARLGLSRNTLAVAVHRLRHRLQSLVEQEVADTLVDAAQFPDELASVRSRLDIGPAG